MFAGWHHFDQGPKKPVGKRSDNTVCGGKTAGYGGKRNQQTGAQLRQMLGKGLLIELFLCVHVVTSKVLLRESNCFSFYPIPALL
jgi:hypothetical protein